MKLFLLMAQIILLVKLSQVKCDLNSLPKDKKYEKFFLNGLKSNQYLQVSTEHYEPFMYRDKNAHFHNGIEYKLFKTIAEKERLVLSFNFVNRLRPINLKKFIFGYSSFKGNNLLGSSNIFADGLFPNVTSNLDWTISRTYYQDDLTWCVQRAKYFPLILNLGAAAPPEIWICTIFGIGHTTALVFYIMVQFDLKYKQRNNRDWPYMLFLVSLPAGIGINQRFQPKWGVFRIFYGFVLIMSMFTWQILFMYGTRFLKVPVQWAQISTIAEITDNELLLMGSTEVLELISFDERYKKSQIDSFYVCPSIDDCLDHLKNDDNKDLAVGGSRQHILNSRSYSPSKIFCFNRDENIASYQPTLLMSKDFALRQRIDKIIQYALEGGLPVKWDRDSQRKKEQLILYIPHPILKLEEMAVLFVFFLIGGWILSISIFFNERFIWRKMQQTNPSCVWKFLEEMADGERHYFKNLLHIRR